MSMRSVVATLALLAWYAAAGAEFAKASARLPGWDGAPLEVAVKEWYKASATDRVALDVDVATAGTWRPSGNAESCVFKTDGARKYARIGGRGVGVSHGISPVEPIALAASAVCMLEIDARVARADDTFIIYVRAFDGNGRDVTEQTPPPAGWTYSPSSKAYVKYPLALAAVGTWASLKASFRVPDGVATMLPMVCPWRGAGADIGRIRVVEGAVARSRPIVFDSSSERDATRRFQSVRNALLMDVRAVADDSGAIRVEVELNDLSNPPKPRALDLEVTLPAQLAGWTWHRNWREDNTIAPDSRFSDDEQAGGFPVTRYPFSAVSKNGSGFAFGTPLDSDAYESRVVTATGIVSRTPLGLLARGEGLGRRAKFRYLLVPFKGSWGFRSAAKAYYAHEAHKMPAPPPEAKEGTWVWPIWPSKGPKEPDDFGHTFWEAPSNVERHPEEIRRAHELGIGVFPYTEVWGMRQHLPTAEDGSHPPVAERLAELEGWAAQTNSGKSWFDAPREEAARACLNSMPMRPDGSFAYVEDKWDSWTTWWRTNPDPRLAKPNRCSLCWDNTLAPRLDEIDGVYLDSVSYGFSVDFRNVRPEHLAVFDAPLVYDRETLRPCTDGMQHMTVFIDWLVGRLHPKGKRLFGNTFDIAHRFTATRIDIFGCEVGGWGGKPCEQSLHSVIKDSYACVQRFFAYRRPVSNLLQEGHWERLCPEVTRRGMEMYIENQMFYGFYPAVSTIGGETKVGYRGWTRYFGAERRYERDRDLFKAAIPVIRRLNRAGWQPETLARTSDAHVWVERYGETSAAECLFTVRNASDKRADVTLTPEFPISSLEPVWRGSVEPQKKEGAFALRLDPWQTAVFKANP